MPEEEGWLEYWSHEGPCVGIDIDGLGEVARGDLEGYHPAPGEDWSARTEPSENSSNEKFIKMVPFRKSNRNDTGEWHDVAVAFMKDMQFREDLDSDGNRFLYAEVIPDIPLTGNWKLESWKIYKRDFEAEDGTVYKDAFVDELHWVNLLSSPFIPDEDSNWTWS